MSLAAETFYTAARRLHKYLATNYWNGQVLTGPDVGIRFNVRIWRFVKGYTPWLPWSDNLVYMQAQGYWIAANWLMSEQWNCQYSHYARACAGAVLARQRPEGYWDYPNPEWAGRIATVEGCYATMGMLATYKHTRYASLLEGAQRWYAYMIDKVGFQGANGMLAINYFANVPGGMVPNNTTLALQMLAILAEATGDDRYRDTCAGMVAWLNHCQLPSGELPYEVESDQGPGRTHFLCYQYNAFEFLDLAEYYRITGDRAIYPVLERLAGYLAHGITDTGAANYDCDHRYPEVTYYTSALARALSRATAMGLGDYRALSERAFTRLLSLQRADGGFAFFSRRNYGMLRDSRSYPRNLAMILYHLLAEGRQRAIVA
jgi:hypothetical protein